MYFIKGGKSTVIYKKGSFLGNDDNRPSSPPQYAPAAHDCRSLFGAVFQAVTVRRLFLRFKLPEISGRYDRNAFEMFKDQKIFIAADDAVDTVVQGRDKNVRIEKDLHEIALKTSSSV